MKVTQKQAVFYRLYSAFKGGNRALIPVYDLMGEVEIVPLGVWGFVSYEVSARLSEMFSENPGLLERKWIKGKSGAEYYGYRISENASRAAISDPKLASFYQKIQLRV